MRSLIVATVLVAAIFSGCAVAKKPRYDQLEGYNFQRYTKDFGKDYSSADQEEQIIREKLFTQRLIEIQLHNADATRTYNMGVNDMSDWTEEERRVLMGNRPFMQAALGDSKHMKKHVAQVGPLPKSVDYRKASPPILSQIKAQGNCGSCWSHAATEEIESMWAIATGELYVMSQQQIVSCTLNPNQCGGTGGCGGATAELAFDLITESNGIQQEWTYPYTSYFGDSHFDSCAAKIAQAKAPRVANISGYTKTTSNDATSVIEALANVGPLAISVDASHWFEYEGGVFTGCNYTNNISMDHSVQLVGYGHDDTNSLDYWIVRNSWSPAWGEDGFIRLVRPAVEECGWNVNNTNGGGCVGGPSSIRACGTCGLAWDALYPNVKLA